MYNQTQNSASHKEISCTHDSVMSQLKGTTLKSGTAKKHNLPTQNITEVAHWILCESHWASWSYPKL